MKNPEFLDHFKKLWLLDLVIAKGSFQSAATHLRISRSAVSQTISQLEKYFGKILIVREKNSVKPTEFCDAILTKARPIFKTLDEFSPVKEESGSIPKIAWMDLGAFEDIAIDVIPEFVGILREKCPGVRIKLKVARSSKLVNMVRKGELCTAVVTDIESSENLTVFPLVEDGLGLYMTRNSDSKVLDFESAKNLGVGMLQSDSDGYPIYFSRFLRSLNLDVQAAFSSDSYESLLRTCLTGTIAAILPHRVARRHSSKLIDVTPDDIAAKNLGKHEIRMVSLQNCDAKENEFLAKELRNLLNRNSLLNRVDLISEIDPVAETSAVFITPAGTFMD